MGRAHFCNLQLPAGLVLLLYDYRFSGNHEWQQAQTAGQAGRGGQIIFFDVDFDLENILSKTFPARRISL